ncbi:MAG TPA: HAD family hydrolase [Syntrophales bacterium]|jgi:phosphoglycolate phosphatase|nr:HAD family hydrolase [Syntrophales bacterium]HQI35154.1 HAD family hydrolase [Syntrophales bacterium]HQJ30849.1 HAD family hydrolase [Syntrophales bacterium]
MCDLLNLKAIVFDFDGTIARLTIDFAAMRRRVLAHLQSLAIAPEGLGHLYVLEMIAAGKQEVSKYLPGYEDDYERQAMSLIRLMEVAAAKRGSLFPGIRTLFSTLKVRGVRTGIVTRNCREAVGVVFPDIGVFVDCVLTRDDTPHVKPHPGHLKEVLAALALPPREAAMVGDHRMDMTLAKEVGVFAVGVLTGHDTAVELTQAGADLILPAASALTGIFAGGPPAA